MASRALAKCNFYRCHNKIARKHNCWECGEPFCDDHLRLHERCGKFKLCKRCWPQHVPWCEKNLPDCRPLKVEKEIGNDGKQWVYLYYDRDRRKHETQHRNGKRVWPCKIGSTTQDDPGKRIMDQIRTACLRYPYAPVGIRTHHALTLEFSIQAALKYAGRYENHGAGREWYLTSEREFEALYHSIADVTGAI